MLPYPAHYINSMPDTKRLVFIPKIDLPGDVYAMFAMNLLC